MTLTEFLQGLIEKAGRATQGPWFLHMIGRMPYGICSDKSRPGSTKIVDCHWGSATDRGLVDYQYIAAAYPQRIAAMAEVCAAAKSFIDDCPVGDDAKPYIAESCGRTEFIQLNEALAKLEAVKE